MRRTVVIVVAAGVWLVAGTRVAAAATLQCGQTVTSSVTLGNDLTNCRGTGLYIGADGITLNLNGHHITAAAGSTGANGIDFAGHGHVTLIGGPGNAVAGFHYGLLVNGAEDIVRQVLTRYNQTIGVYLEGTGDRLIDSTQYRDGEGPEQSGSEPQTPVDDSVLIAGAGDVVDHDSSSYPQFVGIEIDGSGDTVTHSRVVSGYIGSDHEGEFGIELQGDHANVSHNIVSGQTTGLSIGLEQGSGGYFESDSLIRANTVRDVGYEGVSVVGEKDVTVENNQVIGGAVGFQDNQTENSVYTGNRAQNVSLGFNIHSRDVTLTDNIAGSVSSRSGGAQGDGGGFLIELATNVTMVGNNASHELGNYGSTFNTCNEEPSPIMPRFFLCVQDGIEVIDSTNVVLRDNIANFDAGDGIAWGVDLIGDQDGLTGSPPDDHNTGGLVTHNQTDYNHRYGIQARGPVNDGGGNQASGNTLGQCVEVHCT